MSMPTVTTGCNSGIFLGSITSVILKLLTLIAGSSVWKSLFELRSQIKRFNAGAIDLQRQLLDIWRQMDRVNLKQFIRRQIHHGDEETASQRVPDQLRGCGGVAAHLTV